MNASDILALGDNLSSTSILDEDFNVSWEMACIYTSNFVPDFNIKRYEGIYDIIRTTGYKMWHYVLAGSVLLKKYYCDDSYRLKFCCDYESFIKNQFSSNMGDSNFLRFHSILILKIVLRFDEISKSLFLLVLSSANTKDNEDQDSNPKLAIQKFWLEEFHFIIENLPSTATAFDFLSLQSFDLIPTITKMIITNILDLKHSTDVVKCTVVPVLYYIQKVINEQKEEDKNIMVLIYQYKAMSHIWYEILSLNNAIDGIIAIEVCAIIACVLCDIVLSPLHAVPSKTQMQETLKTSSSSSCSSSLAQQLEFDDLRDSFLFSSFYSTIYNRIILPCLLHSNTIMRKRGSYILNCIYQHVSLKSGSDSDGFSSLALDGMNANRNWMADFLDILYQVDNCTSMHLINQIWSYFQHISSIVVTCGHQLTNTTTAKASANKRQFFYCHPPLTFDWLKVLIHCMYRSHIASIRRAIVYRIMSGFIRVPASEESIIWFWRDFIPMLDSAEYYPDNYEPYISEISSYVTLASSNNISANTEDSKEDSTVRFDYIIQVEGLKSIELENRLLEDSAIGTNSRKRLSYVDVSFNRPGALLPIFLARWISDLTNPSSQTRYSLEESIRLLNGLLSGIVSVICNGEFPFLELSTSTEVTSKYVMSSFSAIKWLLAVFAVENVNKLFLNRFNEVIAGMTNTLKSTLLLDVVNYLEGKLDTANDATKRQILRGYCPFILICFGSSSSLESSGMKSTDSSQDIEIRTEKHMYVDKLRLMLKVIIYIGIDNVMLYIHSKDYSTIQQVIACCSRNSELFSRFKNIHDNDISATTPEDCFLLPLYFAFISEDISGNSNLPGQKIVQTSSHNLAVFRDLSRSAFDTIFSTVEKLYNSPYTSKHVQLCCVRFLYGIYTYLYSSPLESHPECRQLYASRIQLSSVSILSFLGVVTQSVISGIDNIITSSIPSQTVSHCFTSFNDIQMTSRVIGYVTRLCCSYSSSCNVEQNRNIFLNNILHMLSKYLAIYSSSSGVTPETSVSGCNEGNHVSKSFQFVIVLTCLSDICDEINIMLLEDAQKNILTHQKGVNMTTYWLNSLLVNVDNILSTIYKYVPTAASVYRRELQMWSTYHDTSNNNSTSTGTSTIAQAAQVGLDLATTLSTYGKYLDHVLRERWKIISVASYISVTLLSALHKMSGDNSAWSSVSSKSMHDSSLSVSCTSFAILLEMLNVIENEFDSINCEAIPHILSSTKYVARLYVKNIEITNNYNQDAHADSSALLNQDLQASFHQSIFNILQISWKVINGDKDAMATCLERYVDVCFDTSTMKILFAAEQQEFFTQVMKLATASKYSLLQYAVYRLYSTWVEYPLLATPYIPYFIQLLIHRDPLQNENNEHTGNRQFESGKRAGASDNICIRLPCRVLGIVEYHPSNSTRIFILQFIELIYKHIDQSKTGKESKDGDIAIVDKCGLCDDISPLIPHLQDIMHRLIEMNMQKEYLENAIVGSNKYGEKLRSWQALCIMSSNVTKGFVESILKNCFKLLTVSCVHSIRVHMEIFCSTIALQYPDVFFPPLLNLLASYNHAPQALASYFIIIGHWIETCYKEENKDEHKALDTTKSSSLTDSLMDAKEGDSEHKHVWCRRILEKLLPWFSCALGLPRAIAQLIGYRIIPIAIQESMDDVVISRNRRNADGIKISNDNDDSSSDSGLITMYKSFWYFLNENKDVKKLRLRQIDFFKEYNLTSKTTLQGLLCIDMDEGGDYVPVHILSILADAVKDSQSEYAIQDVSSSVSVCVSDSLSGGQNIQKLGIFQPNDISQVTDVGNASGSSNGDSHSHSIGSAQFQTKIIPFNELQLRISENVQNQRKTVHQKTRQHMIVCASLVDKITNLAGIARTCEIFAVKELLLSNLEDTKTESFQGISVSSSNWLPMREVKYEQLKAYIKGLRLKGYQIVGVEQTGGSVVLQDAPISEKCFILLGREKEGLPVDLIQEMDICVEIPQFGVTRSLNVHVSAAIVIWEVSRRFRCLKTS